MSVKVAWVLSVVATLFGLLAAAAPTVGQEPKPTTPFDFEGKFLAVMLKSNRDLTHTMAQVKLRKLGDQQFIVGVGVDSGSAPKGYIGLSVWIALSDVSEIQVYRTHDDLKKAFAQAEEEDGSRKPSKK